MISWTTSQSIRRVASACFAMSAVGLAIAAGAARGADPGQDDRGLLRFDPIRYTPEMADRATLVPISEQEAKAGCIYSHFSEPLNRRVWAIRQADGHFSHALGEGTSQPGPAFDIRGTLEERRDKLEQADSDLLKKLGRQGGFVYFKLNHDDRWQLDSIADHATIYDAQTRYRWEWAYGRYVPISSAPFAYRWQVVDGRYLPVADALPWETGCVFAVPPVEAVYRSNCNCHRTLP
jgi:hypothetical protein